MYKLTSGASSGLVYSLPAGPVAPGNKTPFYQNPSFFSKSCLYIKKMKKKEEAKMEDYGKSLGKLGDIEKRFTVIASLDLTLTIFQGYFSSGV